MPAASKGNPLEKSIKKGCIDSWMFDFHWAALGCLEGVQIATESNRNMTAFAALTFSGEQNPNTLIGMANNVLKQYHDQLEMIEAYNAKQEKALEISMDIKDLDSLEKEAKGKDTI